MYVRMHTHTHAHTLCEVTSTLIASCSLSLPPYLDFQGFLSDHVTERDGFGDFIQEYHGKQVNERYVGDSEGCWFTYERMCVSTYVTVHTGECLPVCLCLLVCFLSAMAVCVSVHTCVCVIACLCLCLFVYTPGGPVNPGSPLSPGEPAKGWQGATLIVHQLNIAHTTLLGMKLDLQYIRM